MLFTEQIEKLKSKQNNARSNYEFEKIGRQILKLAKRYNELNYFDKYLIIDDTVYGLQVNRDWML